MKKFSVGLFMGLVMGFFAPVAVIFSNKITRTYAKRGISELIYVSVDRFFYGPPTRPKGFVYDRARHGYVPRGFEKESWS